VLASGLAVKALSKLISLAEPSWLYLALKIALMAAIYTIILFIIRCVGREDAAWLKSVIAPKARRAQGRRRKLSEPLQVASHHKIKQIFD
jgi:hypothetical protein